MEPTLQLSEHLSVAAPRGADEEHPAEPLLIGSISHVETLANLRVGVTQPTLLTPRVPGFSSVGVIAITDPRVPRERLIDLRFGERMREGASQIDRFLHRGERTPGHQGVDPTPHPKA